MTAARTLSYCAVVSLFGTREIADTLFDLVNPGGIDMDQPGDFAATDARAKEREAQDEKCRYCHERCW